MQTRTRVMGWFFMALALASGLPALAHNIRVANVAAVQQDVEAEQVYVAFDLSWDNSWRNEINHDAAWVFVKFRPEGSDDWEHAYLSTNKVDHLMASGATNEVGTTEIASTDRGMGVFIYRDSDGDGSVDYVNTRLLWKYGENGYEFERGDQVELSVHAIEMVYVPEGAFYVGSGGTETGSFTDGGWTEGPTIPLQITSEDALTITNTAGNLWGTDPGNSSRGIGEAGELPAKYPKGFAAFYCMKYQITQGQYAEFLNLLTEAQQTARFPNAYGQDRHTIRLDGDVYVADAPDRACNQISYTDGASYAAWAGLRPMTELEYEKACRGPEYPVANEYAWGTDAYTSISGLTGVDGSGTEYYAEGNLIVSGSDPGGPVRVGIFAREGTTREQAGASYWGIMQLSGNLLERPVWVAGASRNFEGSHGAGTLDLPSDWPSSMGMRGGCWFWSSALAPVSARNYAIDSRTFTDRSGFRPVRRAPSGMGE